MEITKTLKGVIIQDQDGSPILSKIFDEFIGTKQYERELFAKTKSRKANNEVLVIRNTLVVHKLMNEFHFYVIGASNENPLILDSVLECLAEVISTLLNKAFDRVSLQRKLSQIILAFDEICGDGMILEIDSNLVLQRVCLKDDPAEQTMAQKLQSAIEQRSRFSWIPSYN